MKEGARGMVGAKGAREIDFYVPRKWTRFYSRVEVGGRRWVMMRWGTTARGGRDRETSIADGGESMARQGSVRRAVAEGPRENELGISQGEIKTEKHR